ncbi:hypothetical protein ANRL3_01200 [Anaerolineae bacterium]|nr:hypothetical protein ANRL3_01200 [Anaerolineae bacterium]
MMTLGNARGLRWLFAGTLLVLSLVMAFGWLVPVFALGQAPLSAAVKTILAREKDVRKLVTPASGGDASQGLAISAQYGSPEFFAFARREQDILEYQPRETLVFLLTESVGVGQLADHPPIPTLIVDGARKYSPLVQSEELQRWQVVTSSLHQRTSIVRFPRSALTESAKSIELSFARGDGAAPITLRWDFPLAYPDNIARGESLSPGSLSSVALGLLFGLATCLTQLGVVFFATVFGLGTIAPSKVIRFGIRFVVGVVFVYTITGAFAGWLGEAMQSSGLAYQWITPLSVVSGLIVVLLALWMGILARVPVLERIHLPAHFSIETGLGQHLPLMMGSAWALGCVTCFDAVMFPTLLLYTGIQGSLIAGAAILFLFSMGIGVAFLVSTGVMHLGLALIPASSARPGWKPILVLVLALCSAGLGAAMLTGNFHNVSNVAFQWFRALGLF